MWASTHDCKPKDSNHQTHNALLTFGQIVGLEFIRKLLANICQKGED